MMYILIIIHMENIIFSIASVFIFRYLFCQALGRNQIAEDLAHTNRELEESISILGKITCELKLLNKHKDKYWFAYVHTLSIMIYIKQLFKLHKFNFILTFASYFFFKNIPKYG